MSTLHLPRSIPATRPLGLAHVGTLHRSWLRLRSRWLAWRGQALLQVVETPGRALAAQRGQARERYEQELLELNLLLERARAGRDSHHGKPGGMAR